MWSVTYQRPGEQPCQVGSVFDDFERASSFFDYQCKHDNWAGTVRLVAEDGTVIKSVTSTGEAT